MRDIKLLDCTLRDGGYVNGNVFGEKNIRSIIDSLKRSKVDLVEYGYIEEGGLCDKDKTEYCSFDELFELTGQEEGNVLMLLGEKYNIKMLPPAPNDKSYLRVSFHKRHARSGLDKVKLAMEKGYKVFIQPTVTMSYSKGELIELLRLCNELHPVSVAVVDTFGQMFPEDVAEVAKLFDTILDDGIAISFHAHNNLQNAYANAIRFIESVNEKRQIIIDTSIFGMGRGAGNLPTELIMGYLNKKFGKDYDVDAILAVIDDVISGIRKETGWGYSLPYYLSGIYGVHPSYILTFMERKTQNSGDIKNLIDLISDDKKVEFDLEYARDLYNVYNDKVIDDKKSKKQLIRIIDDRKVLLIGPGKTLKKYDSIIDEFIKKEKPCVIGVNGKYDIKGDAVFFSNKKRYRDADLDEGVGTLLLTSNMGLKSGEGRLVFNYGSYLARGCGVSDNALLMMLNVLKDVGVREVVLAGFDGYNTEGNFYKSSLELLLDSNYVNELNKTIKDNIKKLRDGMVIKSITPSRNI